MGRWGDGEPYNITALIKEYESEEIGLKKNIEWLKEEMDSMHRKRDLDRNPDEWFISKTALLKAIDQLDEPEMLSENWIGQKSIDTHVDTLSGEVQVTFRMDDLQNLVVPKQELPVVPKFVVEWLEASRKAEYHLLGAVYDGTYSEDMKEWLFKGDKGTRQYNQDKLTRAWLDGFKVEEEQKYVIDTDDLEISDGNHYLTQLSLSKDDMELPIVGYKDDAMRFENKEQAQAIADYVGGRVEELEE